MSVSVLICTYNRHEMLAAALRALMRCDPLPDEVIVVNGGDDRADQVVEPYLARQDVAFRLMKTRNVNLATSRNVGLPCCTGDIVAMTDDDAEVLPDWVGQIQRAHGEYPEAGAVGGSVISAGGRTLLNQLAELTTFPQQPASCYVRTLPGVNVAYKRAVLESVGPQDETLFRGEDVDFNWRVALAGYKIRFDPAIRVIHHQRATLLRFLNQHYMYGRAYFLVRCKWPEMYCVYPHHMHTLRDVLRLVNFALSPFYAPLLLTLKVNPIRYRLAAYFVLLVQDLGWRLGIILQMLNRAASHWTDHA